MEIYPMEYSSDGKFNTLFVGKLVLDLLENLLHLFNLFSNNSIKLESNLFNPVILVFTFVSFQTFSFPILRYFIREK